MIVDCAIYRDGRRTEGPADFSVALAQCRHGGDAFVWIGLYEPTEKEFDRVTEEFGLHPLAVEDALKAHQRPKLEVYDDSLFMVLKPVGYEPKSDIVSSGEVMVFIGDSFVVTVRHGESTVRGGYGMMNSSPTKHQLAAHDRSTTCPAVGRIVVRTDARAVKPFGAIQEGVSRSHRERAPNVQAADHRCRSSAALYASAPLQLG